jgi:hypothetical protein
VDTAKAVLRGEFIAMSAHIRKLEISNKQSNDAPQTLAKTRKIHSQTDTQIEIRQIRADPEKWLK